MAESFIERLRITYEAAKKIVASHEEMAANLGVTLVAAPSAGNRAKRGRPARTDQTASRETAATKVQMQDIPRLIAERYPTGANFEQIRQMAGWKPTAPAANLERLLVKPGKLVRDEGGIYRAPPPLAATA